MLTLKEVCDLTKRRFGHLLDEYPVLSIYVTLDTVIGIKFVFSTTCKESDPTDLKMKVIHLLDDMEGKVVVRSVRENCLWHDPASYLIYKCESGFIMA